MTAPDRLSLIKARHAEAGGGNGDMEWLLVEVERLRNYLQEISIGRGAYSRDPLQHAENCIRDMKGEAVKALEGKPWKEP